LSIGRGALSGKGARGSTLPREWGSQEVQTTSVEGGWEHEGVLYRSLSGVSKAVTGSHQVAGKHLREIGRDPEVLCAAPDAD
jgi:Protein of unknown function (DUF2924)